jgi:hypothetical protein
MRVQESPYQQLMRIEGPVRRLLSILLYIAFTLALTPIKLFFQFIETAFLSNLGKPKRLDRRERRR